MSDGVNPKDRVGITKPNLNLVPPAACIYEAKVFELGASKYGPYNWRAEKVQASIYYAAALRHLMAWQDGQDIDEESGQPHLAHARACLGILLDAISRKHIVDDRPVPGEAAALIKELTLARP